MGFTLNKNGQVFKAVLKMYPVQQAPQNWQAGCRVRITGICSLSHDDDRPYAGVWQAKSFQILLRSPADLEIIAPPPWWTPRHITILLSVITGTLAFMIGVVMALSRRRLREQERQREMAEAEFAAILSERNRVGRELHDTLSQGLTATSVQLRLARKKMNGASDAVNQHLDAALLLVRESLKEARNSIWNMRAQVLENGDLSDALKAILRQMADGTDMVTMFDSVGRTRRLAPVIENNILRIGQEAIVNATKHSGAKQVQVTLEYEERQFRLRVADDGRGFDPAEPPRSDGGFGLMGMRERAAEMNGKLTLRSAPGQGTEIILNIPLSGE
jgi:signal transduction histidine kinase